MADKKQATVNVTASQKTTKTGYSSYIFLLWLSLLQHQNRLVQFLLPQAIFFSLSLFFLSASPNNCLLLSGRVMQDFGTFQRKKEAVFSFCALMEVCRGNHWKNQIMTFQINIPATVVCRTNGDTGNQATCSMQLHSSAESPFFPRLRAALS